mmetsp:Transcript_27333/g.30702  ORF Transcript_27333/g.30702 Transcript_27333/m.30702 type:complete len:81 (+) Transcript_27333:368-610(+)
MYLLPTPHTPCHKEVPCTVDIDAFFGLSPPIPTPEDDDDDEGPGASIALLREVVDGDGSVLFGRTGPSTTTGYRRYGTGQ